MRHLPTLALAVAFSMVGANSSAAVKLDQENITTIPLSALGGWVLAPDGSTLIVSSPQSAEIVFIDTLAGKELRRAAVDFQPMALAIRGSLLFATGKGSSLLYVLDAETGKLKKEVKVPGEKLDKLACHPTTGPLFATNDAFEVLAINPESGKITKTEAQGNFLATDPIEDDVL